MAVHRTLRNTVGRVQAVRCMTKSKAGRSSNIMQYISSRHQPRNVDFRRVPRADNRLTTRLDPAVAK
eukprot:1413486-Pleurochrysis_carterae.AAC.2